MKLGLALLILCYTSGVFAQDIQWLDKDYLPVTEGSDTTYFYNPKRVRTVYADPDSINIYVVHYASGPLHLIGGFEQAPDSRKWARHTMYFENGTKASRGIFVDNKKMGIWEGWYPDGSLHYKVEFFDEFNYKGLEYVDSAGIYRTTEGQGLFRYCFEDECETGVVQDGLKQGEWKIFDREGSLTHRERYIAGELIEGTWQKGEEVVKYDRIATSAMYDENGIEGFYRFIARNLQYPVEARRKQIEGKIYVQFFVNPDGSIDELEVVQSPHPSFIKEALRVMETTSNWIPARLRGEPVRQKIVAPLIFMLD